MSLKNTFREIRETRVRTITVGEHSYTMDVVVDRKSVVEMAMRNAARKDGLFRCPVRRPPAGAAPDCACRLCQRERKIQGL